MVWTQNKASQKSDETPLLSDRLQKVLNCPLPYSASSCGAILYFTLLLRVSCQLSVLWMGIFPFGRHLYYISKIEKFENFIC